MKNIYIFSGIIISLIVVISLGIILTNRSGQKSPDSQFKQNITKSGQKIKAIVYKSPTCGCCRVYVAYLKKQGFDVEIRDMQDTQSIKNKYKIATDKLSCHTTVIGDYFFEGHIPVEAIAQVLKEKPKIKGIALPGMPSGSPGMPGPKYEKFAIYQLSNNSEWSSYINL